MGSIFLGQILTGILAGRPMSVAPDVPLEPIIPGAWAAWAKAALAEGEAAAKAGQPSGTTVRKVRDGRVALGAHR